MAYGRRWRRYYRRYYRSKYSSYGKMRMSRNFKASANNMTQGGTFNISAHQEVQCDFTTQAGGNISLKDLDISSLIRNSAMHKALSCVFDQYRIEKISVKFRPCGDSTGTVINPSLIFSAVDRSGFAAGIDLPTLRTYGSYKETQVTGAKDISPTHYLLIGQTNLVEFTTYTDTKNAATFPAVKWGAAFANVSANVSLYFSIEMDAQIRYRGVRLDNSGV